MKRLPKGLRKISKEEFTQQIVDYQEEKDNPFAVETKKYEDWSKKDQKKSYKTTFRW